MKKTVKVDDFLRQHEDPAKGYKQFTIDYIEEARYRIEEYQAKPQLAEADFLHAMHYEAENILEIMRDDLNDCAFYLELSRLLSQLADDADAKTRQVRMISKAGLN
jgi:hypothetical protein